MTEMRTLKDLEPMEQALMAELSGIEKALLDLHEREWQIRTELQHIEIQKTRLAGLAQ